MHVLTVRNALPYILWGFGIAALNRHVGWPILSSLVMGLVAAGALLVTRHVILRLPVDLSRQDGAAHEAAVPGGLRRLNTAFLCFMFVLLALGLVPVAGDVVAMLSHALAAAPVWLFWLPMFAVSVCILPLAVGSVRGVEVRTAWRRARLLHAELIATGFAIGVLWTVVDPGLRFRPWGVVLPFIALSLGLLFGMAVMAWRAARKNPLQG